MKRAGLLAQWLFAIGWWLLLNLSETKMGVARDLTAREALLSKWLEGLGPLFVTGVLAAFLLLVLMLSLLCKHYATLPVTVILSLIVYYLSKTSSFPLLGTTGSLLIALIGSVILIRIGFTEKDMTWCKKTLKSRHCIVKSK